MLMSDNINELAAALAKAQGVMKNAALNKVNPHFKSRYADLPAVRDAIVPALSANGIAVVQATDMDDSGRVIVETTLMHASGQWLKGRIPVVAERGGPQALGSALTYARRYGLAAMVGIAADEDDDANTAEPAKGDSKPTTVTKGGGDKIMAARKAEAETFVRMFKGYVDGCADADAASTQWKSNADKLKALKAEFPAMYDELVAWCKEVGNQRQAAE